MHITLRSLPLGLAVACALAHASGSGTFYDEGAKVALTGAYAYWTADPFDETKQITAVVFADKPIDAAALKNASDRGEALGDQLRRQSATRITLNIDADGKVENVNVAAPGVSGSQSGSGWYTITLKQNDTHRIEGTFRSNDENDKRDGRYYDLAFALDLPGAPDLGTALPAGGGEPGKAYLGYLAALRKGDVDALAKTMTKARADEILAHRNDAHFKEMFAFIQEQALHEPKYVDGHAAADSATLTFAGKDSGGKTTTSTVTMARENGAWKVSKESTSTQSG